MTTDKRPATRLVEGGRRKEWRGRLVNPPVERASTILFDSVAELEGSTPGLGDYRYGLQGTATHWALSEALTELEPGAAGTALFSVRPGGDHQRFADRAVAGRRAAGARQRLRPDAQVLRHDPQALRDRDALLRPAASAPTLPG